MSTTSHRNHDDIPWVNTIVIGMSAGIVAALIYSWDERSWTVLACSLIIAVAAAIVGALIGFIFGIPKSTATASSSTVEGTVTAKAEYQGNSNLEQISDWLTKVLVGASLVQLGIIRDEFNALGARFGTSGPMGSSGWIVAPAIIIAFAVSGFLLAYLWARIYMAQTLTATQQSNDVERQKPAAVANGAAANIPPVPEEAAGDKLPVNQKAGEDVVAAQDRQDQAALDTSAAKARADGVGAAAVAGEATNLSQVGAGAKAGT